MLFFKKILGNISMYRVHLVVRTFSVCQKQKETDGILVFNILKRKNNRFMINMSKGGPFSSLMPFSITIFHFLFGRLQNPRLHLYANTSQVSQVYFKFNCSDGVQNTINIIAVQYVYACTRIHIVRTTAFDVNVFHHYRAAFKKKYLIKIS